MRKISPDLAAEFEKNQMYPILMAEMFFDSGTIGMWTGFGSFEWNGVNFLGGGNFIGISPVSEIQGTQAKGITATLNGINSNLISLVFNERLRGRPFRLYLATMSTKSYVATEEDEGRVELEGGDGYVLLENDLIGEPLRIFSGMMDTAEILESGDTCDVSLTVENSLIIGQRSKLRRYTNEDQISQFPQDKGLEFINSLQDKEIVW